MGDATVYPTRGNRNWTSNVPDFSRMYLYDEHLSKSTALIDTESTNQPDDHTNVRRLASPKTDSTFFYETVPQYSSELRELSAYVLSVYRPLRDDELAKLDTALDEVPK